MQPRTIQFTIFFVNSELVSGTVSCVTRVFQPDLLPASLDSRPVLATAKKMAKTFNFISRRLSILNDSFATMDRGLLTLEGAGKIDPRD